MTGKNNNFDRTEVRRRIVVAGAAIPALAWMGAAHAQAKPLVLVGWLNNTSRKANAHYLRAFKEGMATLGWNEGVNYAIEERWAESVSERLQPLALELAAKNPAVVVAATVVATTVASKLIPHTPIVQGDGGSLVTAGLAASLARPGGLVTGVTNMVVEFGGKFLEILLETIPSARRVGFLADVGTQTAEPLAKLYRSVLDQRRIQGFFAKIDKPDDIEPALAQLAKDRIQGLVLLPARFFVAERERIVKIAMANRWPVSCGPHEIAEAGALMSYGADRAALYRRSAYYVDRILKGAKPSDLPIEQPTKFEMLVNLKTAKALGITVPQSVMVRATRVIE